jgi:iron complex transport system substrate-binding protein
MKKFGVIILALALTVGSFSGCSTKEENVVDTDNTIVDEITNEVETTIEDETIAKDVAEQEEVILATGEMIKESAPVVGNLKYEKSLELEYAHAFSVDYYEGGYILLTTSDTYHYLVVPEDAEVPTDLDEDMVVIKKPITGLYVANSPTMSLINRMGALEDVKFSGTEADGWYIDEIADAMNAGSLTFAGKYKEPDYEMLTAGGCNLVIQSSMIESVPEVSEKFEELGMPLIIDRSGEETHPLGKVEWLKFYGVLLDLDMEMVNECFESQVVAVETLSQTDSTDKTVAIFYITSKGSIYVRNTTDYVTKMVELAGGSYIFEELENSGSNSTKMEMEAFYETAKDADYIIYIYSIGGKPETLAELTEKNALLSDFKAVQDGNVWATCPEFFQISDSLGFMIGDINTMLTTDEEITELDYLFKLQ